MNKTTMPPQHVSTKIDAAALLKELQESNEYFDSIVDMIPAKLYISGNTGDEAYSSKYYKGQHKESKESRRARNKAAKRAKFDPSLSETTRETKERLCREESEEMKQESMNVTAGGDEETTAVDEALQDKQKKNNNTSTTLASSLSDKSSRVEALRAKLQAKIAEKRAQRPLADASTISKRAARRAEKQRRKLEAEQKKKLQGGSGGFTKAERTKAKQLSISNNSDNNIIPSPMQDLEQLDFGKLAGLNPGDTNKSLSNITKSKNLQKMLEDAQEKKKKLETLKQSGETEQAQKLLWGDALKEASGQRVKDDPSQIKKQLKRQAAKKSKSQKAWKSRMALVQSKADERQAIRSHNLQQRKLGGSVGAKLSKKRIVSNTTENSTKSRAGFEGRTRKFLNKGKSNSSNSGGGGGGKE